jgi:hypothetical protein
MRQFRIKENGFKEIKKQTLFRAIPIVLIALIVGLVSFEYSNFNSSSSDTNVYPFLIPIILGALAFGLNKGLKRQKEIYDTYSLKIDDEGIEREQANTPSIRLLFSDIKRITRGSKGGFAIKGNTMANSILVPIQIEELLVIESILKDKCNCEIITSKPLIQRLMIPLLILVLGLMATLYISGNKILLGFSGSILSVIMLLSFIKVQSNNSIDSKTRKSSYSFLAVIIFIIAIMLYKIIGPLYLIP